MYILTREAPEPKGKKKQLGDLYTKKTISPSNGYIMDLTWKSKKKVTSCPAMGLVVILGFRQRVASTTAKFDNQPFEVREFVRFRHVAFDPHSRGSIQCLVANIGTHSKNCGRL